MLEKLKNINIKNIIRSFTLVWGLVLIIVMTITNLGFDEKFNWLTWLSNSLILFGIMVFGLLMGESWSKDNRRKAKKGVYQTNLNELDLLLKEIKNEMVYFNQYYSWELPRELHSKKVNYLMSNGLDPVKAERIVSLLTIEDFEQLKKHPIEKNGIIIRKLQEDEIEPVEDVLKGKVKLHPNGPSYFLSAYDDVKENAELLEQGKEIEKTRNKNKHSRRWIKILTSLGISLIFGILTVKDFMSSSDGQAWVNLVSRVTALFTSFFSGWLSGTKDVYLQAQALANKVSVLNLFHTNLKMKTFVPELEDEIAKKEYQKYLESIAIPSQIEDNNIATN